MLVFKLSVKFSEQGCMLQHKKHLIAFFAYEKKNNCALHPVIAVYF